jgi:hypothetical protein
MVHMREVGNTSTCKILVGKLYLKKEPLISGRGSVLSVKIKNSMWRYGLNSVGSV